MFTVLYHHEIHGNTCAYGRVYVYVSSFSTIKVKPSAITTSVTKESQKGRYCPSHHHVKFSIEIRLEGAFGILKGLAETRAIEQTISTETLTELRIGQNAPVLKEIIPHVQISLLLLKIFDTPFLQILTQLIIITPLVPIQLKAEAVKMKNIRTIGYKRIIITFLERKKFEKTISVICPVFLLGTPKITLCRPKHMLLIPHVACLLLYLLLLSGLDTVIHILAKNIKRIIQMKHRRMNCDGLHSGSGIPRKTGSITAIALSVNQVWIQACILIPLHLGSGRVILVLHLPHLEIFIPLILSQLLVGLIGLAGYLQISIVCLILSILAKNSIQNRTAKAANA